MLWDRQELTGTVVQRFARVVAASPRAPAVSWAGRTVTFEHLDHLSDHLAWQLLTRLGDAPEPVPLLSEPDADVIVAVLGILKAGKSYVALNPADTVDYHRLQLETLRPRLLLTTVETETTLTLPRLTIPREVQTGPALPAPVFDGTRTGALVFTSGSSARPKCVVRSHRALLHRAYLYSEEQSVGPGDRQALLAGLHFVASETDLWGALLNGAAVCPYPTGRPELGPLRLWLEQERITLFHPAVGFFRRFARGLEEGFRLPSLRLLALGGEPITRTDLELCWSRLGRHVVVTHRYSSSEAGNVASLCVTPSSYADFSDPIPVGYPCRDKTVEIRSPEGRALPPGQVGEIVVRSRFLSDGYWGEAGHPAECRTGDLGRFDALGRLHHLGRQDSQCKVRGHRVELALIESVLARLPGVLQVAVTVEEGERLTAHLVGPAQGDLSRLVELCRGLLPGGSVPDQFRLRRGLPLNRNGKVDRHRLGADEHLTPSEARLCAVWSSRLHKLVSVEDDFFALGGTSLEALDLLHALEREFGLELDSSVFALAPTPREMARLLLERPPRSLLVPIQEEGPQRPLFCVHPNSGQVLPFLRLSRRLGRQQPLYALRARGLQPGEALLPDISSMACEYVQEISKVQPRGPYRLGGRCMGGLIAFEMARILRAAGHQIELLFLIDSPAPQPLLSPWRKVVWDANHLLRWLNGNLSRPSFVGQRLVHRLTARSRWRSLDRPHQTGHALERALQVAEHLERLGSFHRAAPLSQSLVFYGSERERVFGPPEKWKTFATDGVTFVPLPGRHHTLLQEPSVRYLAWHLKERLRGRVDHPDTR